MMIERRHLLKILPVAALGLTTFGLARKSLRQTPADADAVSPPLAFDPRKQRRIPDVAGVTHTGKHIYLYRDLVKDKVALIHFMSIAGEASYPATTHMAAVARGLGDKLGREVFMISVTRDPVSDIPERLATFAAQYGDINGWTFVNLGSEGTVTLTDRIYHPQAHGGVPARRQYTADVVFYGNGGVGLWGTFPVDIRPDDAARRVAWMMPGKPSAGPPQRGGPRRLNDVGLKSDNRIA